MKLLAIRAREVGRFLAPVALTGFSGALDVLVAANEHGKSTLFKALGAIFRDSYKSDNATLRALRPYAGGAPLIEVDFALAGKRWRLSKQYLSSPQASLRELDGAALHRGADAESALQELFGPAAGGLANTPLFWVAQKERPPVVDGERQHGLHELLALEVTDAAGGGAVRRVAKRVQARLDELMTPSRRQAKKGGPLVRAREAFDRLTRERDAARSRATETEVKGGELQRLRVRHAGLTAPSARDARHTAEAVAKQRLAEAERLRGRLQLAQQSLETARLEHERTKSMLDALVRAEADAAALGTEIGTGEGETRHATSATEAAAAALAGAEGRRAALRRAHFEARLAEAVEVERDTAELARQIAANPATELLLDTARREQSSIELLAARLAAASPSVEVRHDKGAPKRILIDGRPVADGEPVVTDRPLVLTIAGVGTITVRPGASSDAASDRADLDAHRFELKRLLAAIGAGDIDAARRLSRARAEAEARFRETSARRDMLAPEGVEALRAEAARFAAVAGAEEIAAVAEARPVDAAKELTEIEAALPDLRRAAAVAGTRSAALLARQHERRTRFDAATASLPPLTERQPRRAALAEAVGVAERKLNGAVREEVALREAAPSPDVLEALAEAARRGAAATREAAAETQRVEKEIASIEGGLAVLQDDGAGERADRLAGEAEAAAGAVAAIERELRELTLLAKALSEAEAALRTSLETPVLHCIGPYLELVLPRARLALDGGLGPLALSRAGVDEQLDRLSEGTQEQVSILARLGLAALAAERGASLPLVLDDPLAYTDDERLARLLMVLERASAKHQVVVLTSRARAFERLGGTRLSLQPWAAV